MLLTRVTSRQLTISNKDNKITLSSADGLFHAQKHNSVSISNPLGEAVKKVPF